MCICRYSHTRPETSRTRRHRPCRMSHLTMVTAICLALSGSMALQHGSYTLLSLRWWMIRMHRHTEGGSPIRPHTQFELSVVSLSDPFCTPPKYQIYKAKNKTNKNNYHLRYRSALVSWLSWTIRCPSSGFRSLHSPQHQLTVVAALT